MAATRQSIRFFWNADGGLLVAELVHHKSANQKANVFKSA
jgi:hypothetical protein